MLRDTRVSKEYSVYNVIRSTKNVDITTTHLVKIEQTDYNIGKIKTIFN